MTTEKKIEETVYGFLSILFLFSSLMNFSNFRTIELIGEKLKNYIDLGWGDYRLRRFITLNDWCEDLGVKKRFRDEDSIYLRDESEKIKPEVDFAFNEMKNIRSTTNKKYSEIILTYFKQ